MTDAAEMHFRQGDSFLVYPGENGQSIQESVRMMVHDEAMTDLDQQGTCDGTYRR